MPHEITHAEAQSRLTATKAQLRTVQRYTRINTSTAHQLDQAIRFIDMAETGIKILERTQRNA